MLLCCRREINAENLGVAHQPCAVHRHVLRCPAFQEKSLKTGLQFELPTSTRRIISEIDAIPRNFIHKAHGLRRPSLRDGSLLTWILPSQPLSNGQVGLGVVAAPCTSCESRPLNSGPSIVEVLIAANLYL